MPELFNPFNPVEPLFSVFGPQILHALSDEADVGLLVETESDL